MARDFLQDSERAAERLHAGALAVLGLAVNIALGRLHEFGHGGFVWIYSLAEIRRLLADLSFCA
jgi:hypothetical protein